MPTDFFTLRHRDRQRAAAYLQARSKVITAMGVIYKQVEIYNSAQINPASYKSLDIDCRLLELDDDGKPLQPPNSDPSDSIFFEPRGATWVAPVHVTNTQREREVKRYTEQWESVKDNPLVQSLHSQVWFLYSGLEHMFFLFRREFYPEGDDRVPPSLREMFKWAKSGTIVPSVFADRFYSAIWGSIRWFPGKPHTLLVILIKEEPSEELFRAEVMAITIFGRMQARVLEAHYSQQGLVVKKTRLLDFSTNQVANKNMNILLGFMASDLVRDPRGPTAPTDIPTTLPTAEKVDTAKGGTLRKMFRKIRPRVGADTESEQSEGVTQGSSANRMPEVPRNQISQDSPSGPTPALVAAGTRLDEFGSLHEDTYYIKQGRTTDVTGGVCNGVLPVCKWATRYDINGNSVDNKNIRTEEFMIIGVQDRFNESGDSGSFVVDSTGAVVGLLFANYEHHLQTVGLALPVSDLMDTMNDRLKGPVSLRLP
ncbi:hypothetical protein PEX2_029920 [Penicillium expansum]|uniref:Uncharacterized protein n=1 Tax=Penicillium expansum TaxID=27334 RepID=A0A0A2JIK1_PENEN|nr:hypothetical protein PEX2_029920 [Penicillium expansum]KGO39312.1 hypothetical protein PEXP_043930 [Penicillium expansum]KGO55174.1 hypothetical protein PEX2_029920 [Penicillium expansum]